MRLRAVSIVELVIALVILGLLAALTVPVFSRAAEPPLDAQLRADLATLRTAIALYYRDHGVYPGSIAGRDENAQSLEPARRGQLVVRQLAEYTDLGGNPSEQPSAAFCYGPYLRAGIPACVANPEARAQIWAVDGGAAPGFIQEAGDFGWTYDRQTGFIVANSDAADSRGRRYDWY